MLSVLYHTKSKNKFGINRRQVDNTSSNDNTMYRLNTHKKNWTHNKLTTNKIIHQNDIPAAGHSSRMTTTKTNKHSWSITYCNVFNTSTLLLWTFCNDILMTTFVYNTRAYYKTDKYLLTHTKNISTNVQVIICSEYSTSHKDYLLTYLSFLMHEIYTKYTTNLCHRKLHICKQS